MPRIRTIKPEFFTSEDVVALTPFARLLYIALWCEADKEGRLVWKPKTFKIRYLPADSVDMDALCAELTSQGVVRLYGDGLAWIPGFSKHQHVNPRESESDLPAPDGMKASGPRKVGKNTREAVFERDGHKCVRCDSTDSLQVDHILPQSCGGPHIIENLRTLCRSCNAGRPVAGKALEADLAKDGYTIKSLQAKLGIDASILDLHVQGGREGKGKEGNTGADAPELFPGFASFWDAWPTSDRKQARGKCLEVWKKAKAEADAALIVTHVEQMKAGPWRKDGGQFIPAPMTYLNQRRWEGASTSANDDPYGLKDAL